MGRLNVFTRVYKTRIAVWAWILAAASLGIMAVQSARAQYLGTVSQASTVSTITYAGGSAQVIIPPCTSKGQTNCVIMIGQVGHLLTLNYPAGNTCAVWLDGSTDGTHWVVLTSAVLNPVFSTGPTTITANGYYPLLRIKINPAAAATCSAITGTYSGFQTPIPYTNQSLQVPASLNTIATVGLGIFGVPYLWTGMQCYNPNASTAYLQLFDAVATPTLGTGYFYEVGIAGGSTWNYPPGNNLLGVVHAWAGAATTDGGSTKVTTPCTCNFQFNYWGPFFPLNPPSP